MIRYTMTYEKTTPESSEDGEASDRGFLLPGGWEHSTVDAPTGPDFLVWCQEQGPFEQAGTIREVIETLSTFGGIEDNGNGSFYEVDSDVDYSTGEETRRALHIEDTPRNIARLRRCVRAKLGGAL